MKKTIFLRSTFCFLLFTVSWAFPKVNSASLKSYEITPILEDCAEYCEKLSNASMYFVCMEDVKEVINTIIYPKGLSYHIHHRVHPVERHHYMYDYQLIRKNKVIKEKRILLEENGKEINEQNAPLKTKRFTYQHVIFGPIGLLGRQAQPNHTFEIINERRYKGDKVFIIRATPKDKQKNKYLYGDIWIRQKDFVILKIEWNQQSLKNYQWMQEEAERYEADPRTLIVSEYNYEHKGILFPSRYYIKEMYYFKWNPGRFVRSETEVIYKDYQFFTVETEIKYK